PVARVVLAVGAVPESGNVVAERVEPDVEDVLRIAGKGNAPGEAAAADRQVLQPRLDERHDLVAARLREDELAMIGEVFEERFLVFRETEEVRLLLGPVHLVPLIRAATIDDLVFGVEGLAGGAVPAFVSIFVDVTLRQDLLIQPLDPAAMALFRCSDEIVVADPERPPKPAKALDHLIGELHRLQS